MDMRRNGAAMTGFDTRWQAMAKPRVERTRLETHRQSKATQTDALRWNRYAVKRRGYAMK